MVLQTKVHVYHLINDKKTIVNSDCNDKYINVNKIMS